ncbi:MAG: protein kinase domain-containing protein [Acidobacteriota bacterium]
MALSPGTQLDSCEIVDLIGTGGMGEVYRGRDTRLGRDVAVKALPAAFAQDAERLARFTREAQVLASLNHPNIAVIHELKQVGGAQYLIMELVDGETLAQLIERGPVPPHEALTLARQIAEAVEAAHDKGIVHRDLKPANVKVSADGHVKVLDFGLAKIHESSHSSPGSSRSPTLSALNTAAGMILGTAAYMAPEQARGKAVDRRADVWAFGCVLFEMLTGRKTFAQGETVSDTLAGILAREPEWQALPADTPPKVRALLERCLRKDPNRRLQDMGNARIELEEAHGESEAGAAGAAAPVVPVRRYQRVLGAAAAVLCLTTVGLAARLLLAPAPETPVLRFEAVIPVNMAGDSGFHLSPDGLKVAYVTSQPAQIWVRALASEAAEAIPSTEGVSSANIFWSPDSQDIGFFAEGKLKSVAAAGGPAQVLSSLAPGAEYVGTWSAEGVILLASDASPGGPLLRAPAGGGETAPATELDPSRKETSHRFPQFLPDGRHYLFVAAGADARDRAAYVGDLNSNDRRPLPGVAAEVKYSSTGHLVFIRDGALMAQPFDPDRLELTGQAFPVADPFAPATALTYPFSVSTTGTLAFRTNSTAGGITGSTLLWWYDRKGARGETVAAQAEFRGPELSPDGKYVAFARGSPADIWILDVANARTDRLTSHAADDSNPRWSPDGKTVAFDSVRDGAANLYARAVNVVGDETLLLKTESAKAMSDWSRDGKYLVYTADNDIWALPLTGDRKTGDTRAGDATSSEAKPIQVTRTPFMETTPRVSPDGRWVAYASNEPGEYRVYVQSFPDPGYKQLVSTASGVEPRWSGDGKELFYFTGGTYPHTGPTATVMAVSMQAAGSSLTVGAPALRAPRGNTGTTSYSVAADGRFLIQTIVLGLGGGLGTRPVGTNREFPVMTVILNWAGGAGEAGGAGR